MGWIAENLESLRALQIRQLLTQAVTLGIILSSALMIWKGLMCITGSESPVVVVLSESMEPANRSFSGNKIAVSGFWELGQHMGFIQKSGQQVNVFWGLDSRRGVAEILWTTMELVLNTPDSKLEHLGQQFGGPRQQDSKSTLAGNSGQQDYSAP
ncbi:hypothetical protein M5K25_009611 [Dendrobium thyrsiflorum]|uniref:Signal peptidase complex catalytic subunit SEC11 n=1 Tax=Dendrobium thyrsiflorum TaxID=117978 RepID=A0ABD0VCY1_DENTH